MRRLYDEKLENLDKLLIQMASLVEYNIAQAIKSLIEKDIDLAHRVIEKDDQVNLIEKRIEGHCLNLILTEQPVAKDLRTISASLKIITDLERIGDYAKDIAEITIALNGDKYIKEIVDIKKMEEIVLKMLELSLDSFIERDLQLAQEVVAMDLEVNRLYETVKLDLFQLVRQDSKNGEQALYLMLIAKYLERIGDHAQNIGEWVVYIIEGKHIF